MMQAVNASKRVTLAISGAYHAVLKLLAAARAVTLTELVEGACPELAEGLLCDGLCREFECDPRLESVVRELVLCDEPVSALDKVAYAVPMLSLENALTEEEFLELIGEGSE